MPVPSRTDYARSIENRLCPFHRESVMLVPSGTDYVLGNVQDLEGRGWVHRVLSSDTVITLSSVLTSVMIDELEVKSFESPDETMTLKNAKGEGVQMGERKFWLATAEPGWKFSRDNGPDLGTELCPSPHRLYMLSGQMTVEMEDGTRKTLTKGDVALLPPGHDAWVEGDEQVRWFEEELEE